MSRKNIWKSIKEYQEDPEVLKAKLDEFKEGVTDEFTPDDMNKVSRRKFLAVLAASTAYAATACTSYRDKGEIVPYVDRPEEILPGKPTYYASTYIENGKTSGILVKTREGRPIILEGNPDDLINKGKISSQAHASILNLYDPERLKEPRFNGRKISWKKVDKEITTKLNSLVEEKKEIALISNPLTSPTTQKVISEFINKYPSTKLYYTQLVNSNNRKKAWKLAFGSEIIPTIRWDKAKVILSLESDFLGREGNHIENSILYVKGRDVVNTKDLNKLFTVEAGMSLTGMNSDVRLRLKPQLQFEFVLTLINELSSKGIISSSKLSKNISNFIAGKTVDKFVTKSGIRKDKILELINDISSNKGKTIISAGDKLDIETHLIVNLLNELLGANSLYEFESGYLTEDISTSNEIKDLVSKMNNGKVGMVINLEANPIYELSRGFGFKEALTKVETVISISEAPNETVAAANYVLPINNFLESWGDHKTRNGQITLQQPVINPLFNTLPKETILLNWIYGQSDSLDRYQEYLKSNIKDYVYSVGNYAIDFEQFWHSVLHDGVISVKSKKVSLSKLDQSKISVPKYISKGFTLVLEDNYGIGTGKYANNGWLQELPHPVTKVTWDNFAAIAPATAELNALENNDLISVSVNGKEFNLPVMIQPGMAEDVIVTELGYGRTKSGEVANDVGFDVAIALGTESVSQYIFGGVEISKTGEKYQLASTQEHHSLNEEFVKDFHRIRKIIQEGTLEEYKDNPHFLHENKHEIFSITDNHEYKNEKWAMSIDLNKCLGCSECISSCNVDNNIPVVGKDQVMIGREMQWLRIDRYYSGTPEEPIVSTQPMLCQQCDNAPCENVCPVNATNHSPDGLNQMVYNRCVGTRYCANNCPYKVRRFNFYNFRDHFEDGYYNNELSYLANNPEVTVRSRGVIEKCSFCVQHIMAAREQAIKEGRELLPNEVKTTCQTACPTDAIVFGDANNPKSDINKHRKHDLSYHVLEELNVRPNVTYLAKIRNTRTEDV